MEENKWFKKAKNLQALKKAYESYCSHYENLRNAERMSYPAYDEEMREAWAGYEARQAELSMAGK